MASGKYTTQERGSVILKRLFASVLLITLVTSVLMSPTSQRAQAQSSITLVLNVPSLWENTLTPELLAEFEAQNPGVTVAITYSDTAFFGFGPGTSSTTVDERLDDTEEFV